MTVLIATSRRSDKMAKAYSLTVWEDELYISVTELEVSEHDPQEDILEVQHFIKTAENLDKALDWIKKKILAGGEL